MSSLFNKLEDVIDFQLTPLGRKKLRDGKFNPKYYAFGDSDILYDSLYSGITGSQNSVHENLDNIDRNRLSTYPTNNIEKYKLYKNEFYAPSLLGSSELGNNLYPAFDLKLHSSNISGSVIYQTSTFLNQKKPVINITVKCNYDKSDNEFINDHSIVLELNEINGIFEKENFEISFYKKESDKEILLDFFEREMFDTEVEVYKNEVLYWFDTSFDEDVSQYISFGEIFTQNESIYSQIENQDNSGDC